MKYQLMILTGLGYVLLMGGFFVKSPDMVQINLEWLFEKEQNSTSLPINQNIIPSMVEGWPTIGPENSGNLHVRILGEKAGNSIQEKARTVLIEIVPELMKFDTDTFTVVAGEKILLELDNLDGMQHNLLIVKPATLEKVGTAADAMLRDPKASEKHYVPDMPEVLFATEMLGPRELYTLSFTAPAIPGDYPFVCTFPGHWRMMNGIMRVEGKK